MIPTGCLLVYYEHAEGSSCAETQLITRQSRPQEDTTGRSPAYREGVGAGGRALDMRYAYYDVFRNFYIKRRRIKAEIKLPLCLIKHL